MGYVRNRTEKERINLLSLDPDGETWADVRHVKGKDELVLDQVRTTSEFSYKNDGQDISERLPTPEYLVRARKVWIALLDTNILVPDSESAVEEGQEGPATRKWFTPGLEWSDFLKLWGEAELIEQSALYRAVTDVNPHWGN